ncbi:MAG TPA: hypothetical protein P5531_11070 [Bacteroidales bacterium]|nr:hypothetical protein [Bacteroidales bacterium]
MKKLIAVLFFSMMVVQQAMPSHYMGGEIYWECVSDGRYVFHMRVYQECAGVLYPLVTLNIITTVPGMQTILMTLIDTNDISPVCYPGSPPVFPHLDCETTTISNTGGIREWIYRSDTLVLPSLIPPATGWYFYYTNCCRNPCSNISGTTSMSWFLQAVMYPFHNRPANPCYDNSPAFAEKPVFVTQAGYHLSYNHNGYDPDGDSLVFSWAPPMTGMGTPIPGTFYNPGYAFNSPLPGPWHHPSNDPAQLNPYTGQIVFSSFTTGAFVTKVCCQTYRAGILTAEVYREIQMVILPMTNNHPPGVLAPFPNNLYDHWADTVYPGTVINLPLQADDLELLNDGITPQSVLITASGVQFGTAYSNTLSGCPEPPCAILTPPVPLSGLSTAVTIFSWEPDCSHLSYGYSNYDEYVDYQFVFTFSDDYCPVPGRVTRTLRIIMKDPVLPPPLLDSFSIHPLTGHVTLHWTPVTDTLNAFDSYHIFFKDQPGGSYSVVDSVYNINQSSYTYTGINANIQPFWCMLKCRSGCPGRLKFSAPSNVLSNYATGTDGMYPPIHLHHVFMDAEAATLTVSMQSSEYARCRILIYSALGSVITERDINLVQGLNTLAIPLAAPRPGLYFFSIQSNACCMHQKCILLR